MKPQVSVIVLAYNEGEEIVSCLERILISVELPCEVLVVYDSPDDTSVPWIEKCQRTDPRIVPVLNLYGRGPARGNPVRICASRRRCSRGDHGGRV